MATLLKNNIKFLQVGLGSMGKRRIRNLLALGIPSVHIVGFDLAAERRQEAEEKYQIRTVADFSAGVATQPDAYIISTPPDHHAEYFLHAARAKKHFFVEIPTSDEGYNELYSLLDGSFVGAPSCTYRFHPAVKKIKQIVESGALGKIYLYNCHLGQYLPDWHPWEDYRSVFFAQKSTGGCREMMPYELNWQSYILQSWPVVAKGLTKKVSDLDMPADDVYSALVVFDNGAIGNVVIELLSRTPKRTLRLIGSLGTLEWEWQENYIRLFEAKNKSWQEINLAVGQKEQNYVVTEDMYIEEIEHFVAAITGNRLFPYTFADIINCSGPCSRLKETDRNPRLK